MKHRILTAVVVIPLFIALSTTPAHALLGSILAGIQRAQMIINQGLQIYEQKIAKLTMDGQLTELGDQFSHIKDQALGTVGALTDPFTDLASVPTQFIGIGLSWKNDFSGVAAEVTGAVENMGETGKSFRESWAQRLTDADTVSETDILNLYAGRSPGDRGAGFARLSRGAGTRRQSAGPRSRHERGSGQSHDRGKGRREVL